MNIKLSYLYRDGGNYKQFHEEIFTNNSNLSLEYIRNVIHTCLIDQEYFYVQDWQLKDLHLFYWDEELDHNLHEYEGIEETMEDATNIDITQFLKRIVAFQSKYEDLSFQEQNRRCKT